MDETEDNEGKEAGANSSVCEESKETNSCTNSDQNDPNEEQLQENNAEEPEAEKQKEHESEHNEAGPSKCKDDKEDDSATIQPEDEANEEPALVDGKEGADTAADKEIENNENQSKKNDDEDDDEDNMEESKIEMVDESRTNDKPVDEGRENGETKEKDSEMEAPEEMEMKDVSDSECPDVLEDGEILEESQASTSQDVSVSQEDVSLEEPDTIEEAVEVKTFEEAKERIGVLEKRIEREVGHRTDLMKQVRSLRLELHKVKGGSDLETQTVGVQTDPECIQIYDEQPPTLQAEVYQVVESSGTAQQGPSAAAGATQWPTRTPAQASSSTQAQSVAESVRATAEAALAQSGVVLDEASGMYYDYNSGYYYDPNNHLYYDPARGMYYFYDEQTQSYQFHSKIDLPEVVVTGTKGSRSQSDRKRHERERQKGERSRKGRNPDQSREEEGYLIAGMTSLSLNEQDHTYYGQQINYFCCPQNTATKVDYPPCIRMIVVRSESMKLGSLSIVTCTGGTIGREGSNHILLVPELGVSKTHAQMLYDTERRCYTITDLGSQNGTVLNGVPLTRKSRVKSDPQPLSHKDYLTFGTTTLRIHIHRGDETCDECEPGQVQATFRHQQSTEVTPVLSHADKEQQRRKELRKIKKKYLLAGTGYSQREPSRSHPGYKDRAGERRVTVGSDNPYQPNDMPASVDRAISGSNMGHKMLKKMGWQEGQSLGKNESGIKEPIQVFVHSKKSGLGTGNQKSMDNLGLIGKRKSEHWERARDRYHHLDHGASGSASTSSSRQHTRPQEMKWVKGTTQVHEPPADSAPQKDDDGDVEVVSEVVAMEDGETTRKDAVNKDTVHNVCDVDMDHDDKKNGGGGDGKRAESSNGEGSSKNGVGVEIKAAGEIAEEVPSVSGDGSKTIPSSSNSVTISNDVTENQNNAEPESTSNSDLQNQVDGSNARQTRLESTNSKADPQGPSRMSNSLSSKDEQNSVEVPAEREAAKKPIRFVIPPRMNSKGDLGKTPLTASRSVSDSNGEGPSTRRTRQSSRRGKEKKDNIDMFDDG
ncbi:angiogenic factor with G patch and FHA domains 1 isoform X3 [Strongylocentrotus purpuratus]|uniref:Angiogenic factor with G patch and FHA domains 1 n=1 Tax=Strongylocentrotus purpuratus TaxID=7668 RepID=A0A7M7N7R4_STRPU|nr:angiogenic factor with G patch and FHA domains 1 isoform X3 [Strongylocentrotus purpuratus]